jgi:hypothetical protein
MKLKSINKGVYHNGEALTTLEALSDRIASGDPILFMGNQEEQKVVLCKVRCSGHMIYLETTEDWGRRAKGSLIKLEASVFETWKANSLFYSLIEETRKIKMNYNTLATLANEATVTTAAVSFGLDMEEYIYKVTWELAAKLCKGDLVVVANQAGAPHKVAILGTVHASPEVDVYDDLDYTWIVDRVRTDDFEKASGKERHLAAALQKEHRRVTARQAMEKLGLAGFDVSLAIADANEESK